jgi:lysophospholipase L1-like esterase
VSELKKYTVSRVHPLAANLLVVLCGLIAGILLLEALLQFHNPFQSRIKGDRIILVAGKKYHIENNIIKSLDPHVTVIKNSLGFRGAEPPVDVENHLSLVTIGGSTTHCFFLNENQTWTAKLGDKLGQSFRSVWVNNAGLDGHSTYGHLALLQDYIVPLHPKVAVFLIGVNDVAANSMSASDVENVRSGIQFRSPRVLLKSLSAYSEVAALVLNLYRSLTAYQAGLLHHQLDLTKQGYVDVPEEEQKKFLVRYAGKYLKAYEGRVKRIVEVSRAANMEPVLVTQPFLAGIGTDDVTGIDLERIGTADFGLDVGGRKQNGQLAWDLLEVYNDVTRQVGLESKVLVVDLAKKLPKTSRYFYDFIHFTPRGAEAIASIIFESICPMLQTKFPQYQIDRCKD